MKYSRIIFPIFLSIAMLAGIVIGVFFDFPAKSVALTESTQRENKLRQILNYIDFEYVDNLNTDSILDVTISDLLRKLDPHSAYIPQDQVAATEETIKGSFEGIGIEFRIFKDTLTVIRAIEGGPSEKVGIRAGDRILMAADRQMYGQDLKNADVIETLKGESGTRVSLAMYHPLDGTKEVVTVKRGEVPINSVQTVFMVDDSTGYIKLVRFSATTGKEFNKALKQLRKEGAERIIFDLRDNPGGLLSAAREVSDELLGNDEMIVFTKNREGDKNVVKAGSSGLFQDGPLVLLINEGSASASEIVAGAIQDNDRGWVIGRKSFGKGLVQEEMTLNDGSKIRLTTRRYYTPSGRSIQKPFEDYDQNYLQRKGYHDGDSQALNDTLPANKIYRTLNGRPVFGGGGIEPDIKVNLDTSRAGVILYHLAALGNIDIKAFAYVDDHRAEFESLNRKDFMKAFEVTDTVMHYFFGNNADELKKYDENINTLLRARVKAYLGYYLYGNSAFQEAYGQYDPFIREALRILNENGESPELKELESMVE